MKVTGTGGKEYTIKSDTNLRDTNLSKANLEWANLSGADLSGAVWNDGTVFPEGFEIPEKSGT